MKPPAFQCYADDLLSGTADMTREEFGIYWTLICHSWNKNGLENHPKRLAVLVGKCSGDAEASAMAILKWKFFLAPDGRWRNERQEEIRQKTFAFIQAQREKAMSRWHPARIGVTASELLNALPAGEGGNAAASAGDKPSERPARNASHALTESQREIASRFERCLNGQWVNDAGKWITRIKGRATWAKAQRVVAEVELAIREKRVETTPAQYAEQLWKEFAA